MREYTPLLSTLPCAYYYNILSSSKNFPSGVAEVRSCKRFTCSLSCFIGPLLVVVFGGGEGVVVVDGSSASQW